MSGHIGVCVCACTRAHVTICTHWWPRCDTGQTEHWMDCVIALCLINSRQGPSLILELATGCPASPSYLAVQTAPVLGLQVQAASLAFTWVLGTELGSSSVANVLTQIAISPVLV